MDIWKALIGVWDLNTLKTAILNLWKFIHFANPFVDRNLFFFFFFFNLHYRE